MLSTQPYKGTRDFYPEDKRIQKYMFTKWREVFELYGYEEYDAPVLEPTELYLAKGNEEIIQEQTYTFMDRGDRSVTLRTEMTPSVSRLVAGRRQELPYPLRWYSMPNLYRYERPQKGRLREFWQPNVDIFGVAGLEAEQEVIQVADATLLSFGAKRDMYSIKLNNRALMDYINTDYLGLDSVQSTTLIRLIDRMNKLESAVFTGMVDAIFSPSQRDAGLNDKLASILAAKSLKDLPAEVAAAEPAKDLAALVELLHLQGISNAVYDPTLMRGFDYYTGIVFEVFDNDPENNRAMFGGGRYDGLIAQFGVEPVPSVGLARAGRDRAGAAHLGEGGFGSDSVGVVASGDEHLRGDVESDADGLDKPRGDGFGLLLEVLAVDLDLVMEQKPAPRNVTVRYEYLTLKMLESGPSDEYRK